MFSFKVAADAPLLRTNAVGFDQLWIAIAQGDVSSNIHTEHARLFTMIDSQGAILGVSNMPCEGPVA
jgi:hypothetical protein